MRTTDPIVAVVLAAAVFTGVGYALSAAVNRGEPARPASLSSTFCRMILTLGCGLTGAFAVSRGWQLTQILMTAAVVCPLAAIAYAGARGRLPSAYFALPPLIFVGVAAVFDGAWFTVVAAALAAIPFAICTVWFPRPSAFVDTLLSAVAGASLGLMPAILVLFIAAFATIAQAKLRAGTPGDAATISFSPYIATVTFIAIFGSVAVTA